MTWASWLRWIGVLLGTAGWTLYPAVMWLGIDARWLVRCENVPITGAMDSCHDDYLPAVELVWALIAWLLTPLFFRLAIGLLTPRPDGWVRWPLGGRHGDHHPMPAVCGGIGICWAGWNLASIPFRIRFALPIGYWFGMSLWFIGACGLYRREHRASDGTV